MSRTSWGIAAALPGLGTGIALAAASLLRIELWPESAFLALAWSACLGALLGHGISTLRSAGAASTLGASAGGIVAAAASLIAVTQAFANNRMNWWVAEPFGAMLWTALLAPLVGAIALGARLRRIDEGGGAPPWFARGLLWLQGGAVVLWVLFWTWTWNEAVQDLQYHLGRVLWRLCHG